jgi:hypothetical protein
MTDFIYRDLHNMKPNMNDTGDIESYEVSEFYDESMFDLATGALDEFMRARMKRLECELYGAYRFGCPYLHVIVPYPIYGAPDADSDDIHVPLKTIYIPSYREEPLTSMARKGSVTTYDLTKVDEEQLEDYKHTCDLN